MLAKIPTVLFLLVLFGVVPYLSYRTHKKGDALTLPRSAVYLSAVFSQWVLFAVMLVVLWLEGSGIRDLGFRAVPLLYAFQLAALATVVAFGIGFGLWFARRALQQVESAMLRHLIPRTAIEKLMFAVLVSVTAGFVEETLYRGYAITRLTPLCGGPWIAAIVASVAFSLGHVYQGPIGILRSGTIGMALAVPYLITGSLWPSIIAHTMIDIISGVLLGRMILDEDESEEEPADDGPNRPSAHEPAVTAAETVTLPSDPSDASTTSAGDEPTVEFES